MHAQFEDKDQGRSARTSSLRGECVLACIPGYWRASTFSCALVSRFLRIRRVERGLCSRPERERQHTLINGPGSGPCRYACGR
eukprot:6196829-Pleurochrysis_carterae.AAC.6